MITGEHFFLGGISRFPEEEYIPYPRDKFGTSILYNSWFRGLQLVGFDGNMIKSGETSPRLGIYKISIVVCRISDLRASHFRGSTSFRFYLYLDCISHHGSIITLEIIQVTYRCFTQWWRRPYYIDYKKGLKRDTPTTHMYISM